MVINAYLLTAIPGGKSVLQEFRTYFLLLRAPRFILVYFCFVLFAFVARAAHAVNAQCEWTPCMNNLHMWRDFAQNDHIRL